MLPPRRLDRLEGVILIARHCIFWLLVSILASIGLDSARAGEVLRFEAVGQGPATADPQRIARAADTAGSTLVARDLGGGTWWRSRLPERSEGHVDDAPTVLHFRSGVRSQLTLWFPASGSRIERTWRADAGPAWGLRDDLPVLLPAGLAPGSTIFLHVRDPGGREVRAIASPLDEYLARALLRKLVIVTSVAVLLTLSLIAVLLWRGFGGVAYAYLALIALLMAGYILCITGEIYQFIDHPLLLAWSVPLQRSFAMLAVAFSHLFIVSYLELARRRPRMRILLLAVGACQVLIAIIGWIEGPYPHVAGATISNLLILGLIPLILLEAWRAHRDRLKAGRYVLWAWAPGLVLLGLWIFALQGWVPAAWLDIGGLVFYGLAAQVAVLLLGLADDTARLRRERDTATVEAGRDALTGVLNRRALEQQLQGLLTRQHAAGQPISAVFLDIDHFKRINDRHGHAAGDECLRILVRRCEEALRRGDLLARYGGEEFVLVLPGASGHDAWLWAERLRHSIAQEPFEADGHMIRVEASLGVCEWRGGEPVAAWLARADEALYRAKRDGRNRAVLWADHTADENGASTSV
jgi:diguanylate cyclase (GGDEF)-like protein